MSEKVNEVMEILKSLTLLEASELVSQIEETFNVDTSASVGAVSVVAASDGSGAAGGGADEKTEFDVVLEEVPSDKKISVLKVVRNITGLGLKEAKTMVDSTPQTIKEAAAKNEAEDIKVQLEEAGAKVSLK